MNHHILSSKVLLYVIMTSWLFSIAHAHSSCPSWCTCTPCDNKMNDSLTKVKCHVKNVENLTTTLPGSLCSLDLSGSFVSHLPSNAFAKFSTLNKLLLNNTGLRGIGRNAFAGLSHLQSLSLSNNKLQKISAGMLRGLESLTHLNFQGNKLRLWSVPFSRELPKLAYLNIQGNEKLRLARKVLKNSRIVFITGATVSSSCGECDLARSNTSSNYIRQKNPCQHFDIEESKFICTLKSKTNCAIVFSVKEVKIPNHCFAAATSLYPVEFTLGILAISVNFFILVTTVLSKSLRCKPSFVLIANMALGDLFIGAYSTAVAAGHRYYVNEKQFRTFRNETCPYIRSVLVIGEFVGVAVSLIISIERYIATVQWRKPQLKLKLKTTLFALLLCWVFAVGVCLSLEFYNPENISDNYMCVLVRNFSSIKSFLAGQAVMVLLVFMYIIVIAFYVRIYVFLRKTGQNIGSHRETTLAKRIGVIVVTNGIFFVGPNLLFLCLTLSVPSGTLGSDPILDFLLRKWTPPICMVVNANLDPIFYAYKNKTFLNAFKNIMYTLGAKLSPIECIRRNLTRIHPLDETCTHSNARKNGVNP